MGRSRAATGQLGLFQEPAPPVEIARSPRFRLSPPKPDLAENDVERQVNEFLAARGWFPIRVHILGPIKMPDGRFLRVGHKDMPDWIAVRGRPLGFLWYELKRPGEQPTEGQLAYLAMLEKLGHQAVWADSAAAFERQVAIRSLV